MCQLPAVRLMAAETGQGLADVGLTTARPPWTSVPMGALAGRPFEPAKRSAIHPRHRELGASVMWAGDWRRAYHYGDPAGRGAGRARGRRFDRRVDAWQAARARPRGGPFLDRLYPNRFSDSEAGPRPLRRDDLRCRADHGRRHDLPPGRGQLLRDHDLQRRRRRRAVVLVVAGRLAHGGRAHRRHPGPVGGQPRRSARARDPGQRHRPGLLERSVSLSGCSPGGGGRRAAA